MSWAGPWMGAERAKAAPDGVWRYCRRRRCRTLNSLFPLRTPAADPANPAALCDPVSNTTIDPPANSYPVFSLLGALSKPPCGRERSGWLASD